LPSLLALALVKASAKTPEAFLGELSAATASVDRKALEALFQDPARDCPYLFEMAASRGGMGKVQVCLLPSPPGWKGYGRLWAVFHTKQMIEEGHDPVYRVDDTPNGLRLGREIPEDDLAGWRIKRASYRAELDPARSAINVQADVSLTGGGPRALPFRVNDFYRFGSGTAEETQTSFVLPRAGQLVRAGSLLIPWTARPAKQYRFAYSGTLPSGPDDEIVKNAAYVTAWWLPSLGRLPFTVESTVEGPENWMTRAEGVPLGSWRRNGKRVSKFACDLPISFPKIVAGEYVAAAKDRSFAIYQLAPLNVPAAQRDLIAPKEAAAFYESTLCPLPFKGYECYEADKFYGIESYSHTLLQRDVTHFISHEMGHSYFGGYVPCTYVHDSWNEGVTQYFDSVLYQHDKDRTLEYGLRTLQIRVPLSQMAVPWANGSATYWRGAYVMKMLEDEIGLPAVLRACRAMVMERRGIDTRWADLRPYFERAAKTDLGWFWRQWIESAQFPTLEIQSSQVNPSGAGFRSVVRVVQSGTPAPYRLRFALNVGETTKSVTMDRNVQVFAVQSIKKPHNFSIEILPFTLAKVLQKS
jgi:hypothetical protein